MHSSLADNREREKRLSTASPAQPLLEQPDACVVTIAWPSCLGLVLMLLPILFLSVTFSLAIRIGRVTLADFSISASIDKGIGRPLGMLGIGVFSTLMTVAALLRYFSIKAVHIFSSPTADHLRCRIALLNALTFVFQITSAFALLGVAAFNVSSEFGFLPHACFTLVTVGAGALSMCCAVPLEYHLAVAHHHACLPYPIPMSLVMVRAFMAVLSLFGFALGVTGMMVEPPHTLTLFCAGELTFAAAFLAFHATWIVYHHRAVVQMRVLFRTS